jgi:hypothetical protein
MQIIAAAIIFVIAGLFRVMVHGQLAKHGG